MEVSTVIAAYEAAEFVGCAVASARGQSDEVVVVDDGSTDDTGARAAAAGARVIRTENRGAAAARNTGLAEARGRWIALLDADDYWLPGALAARLERVEARDVAVVARARFVSADGRPLRRAIWGRAGRPGFQDLLVEDTMPVSSTMVRREVLLELGGFDGTLPQGADHDLFLRMAHRYPGRILALEETDTMLRRRPGQITKDYGKMLRAWGEILGRMEVLDAEAVRSVRDRAEGNARRVASLSALESGQCGEAWRLLAEGIRLAPGSLLADGRTWKQAAGIIAARLWRRGFTFLYGW
jgi:glycosyltransferase involved in cell wall biosynthesis